MKGLKYTFLFLFFSISFSTWGQNAKLEGYAFEEHNRGYLNLVKITILDNNSKAVIAQIYSNLDGLFTTMLPLGQDYVLRAEKSVFEKTEIIVSTKGLQADQKVFAKIKMTRKPGYIFDVTMAEEGDGINPTDAIQGARVEIYNNTKKKEVLVLENHPIPTFSTTFENGNHYTVMIRKESFFTKRMEAFVNVEGCILCFEGIGEVRPGVSDNLTARNTKGTLIANVELKKIELNKGIVLDNIYYDYNKSEIRADAAKELDKLITVLNDNPNLIVELGSHTDSRGKDPYNMTLSQQRAQAAVEYVKSMGSIDEHRIKPRGYGESNLINNCKNGVKCSESKHQKNRRTELKIIGYMANSSVQKSLKEIIEEEEMDRMIANLSNEGEIKVQSGEDMPEELKKQNAASRNNVITNSETAETKPTMTSPPVVASKPSKPFQQTQTATSNTNFDKATTILEPVVANNNPPTKKKTNNFTRPNPNVNSVVGTKTQEQLSNNSKIIEEYKIAANSRFKKPKPLAHNYKGYRIEFLRSSFELPASHEIFSQHGSITLEQTKGGSYAYLLGNFREIKGAKGFLENVIKARYPAAKVVKYLNGNRLVR